MNPTQKKSDQTTTNQPPKPDQTSDLLAEIDNEISAALNTKTLKYSWMIPVLVVMVVGATIYLSVLDKKIEYVYSLASACFGYYFGMITPKPPTDNKKQ